MKTAGSALTVALLAVASNAEPIRRSSYDTQLPLVDDVRRSPIPDYPMYIA